MNPSPRNRPFVDGNKRVALLAALTLLDLNGYSIDRPNQILVDITLEVAAGSMGKGQVAIVFRDLVAGQL